MSGSKASIATIISFAGAYVATVIGSGFATGQEIMQFFSYYGYGGVVAGIISMVVFMWIGALLMVKGKELQLKDDNKIYHVFCGKTLGTFFEWFGPIFLFGVFVVMISGSGATLNEYYGLNPSVGVIGMAVISFLSVSLGLDKLSKILGGIGPIIIVFTIVVGAISLYNNFGNLSESAQLVATLDVKKPAPNIFLAGLTYASYNVIIVMAFLTSLGATAKNKKEGLWGGILGAFALMAAAIMMGLAILSNIEVLSTKAIPSLVLADSISPFVGIAFSVVLILGIYTTATPLLWTVTNRFIPEGSPKFKIGVLVVTVLGLAGGFLPFEKLVGILYPITGYIGILILVCALVRQITGKWGDVSKYQKPGASRNKEIS